VDARMIFVAATAYCKQSQIRYGVIGKSGLPRLLVHNQPFQIFQREHYV